MKTSISEFEAQARLEGLRPLPGPDATVFVNGRRRLLTHLATRPTGRGFAIPAAPRIAGLALGAFLFGSAAFGAAAAGGAVNTSVGDLLGSIGVTLPEQAQSRVDEIGDVGPPFEVPPQSPPGQQSAGQESIQSLEILPAAAAHGLAVSEAVKAALEATEPGPARGQAVANAACTAARDRTTLPAPAQAAQPNGPQAPCPEPDDTITTTAQPENVPPVQAPPVDVPPANPGPPATTPGQGTPPTDPGPPATIPGQGTPPTDLGPPQDVPPTGPQNLIVPLPPQSSPAAAEGAGNAETPPVIEPPAGPPEGPPGPPPSVPAGGRQN